MRISLKKSEGEREKRGRDKKEGENETGTAGGATFGYPGMRELSAAGNFQPLRTLQQHQ